MLEKSNQEFKTRTRLMQTKCEKQDENLYVISLAYHDGNFSNVLSGMLVKAKFSQS